MKTLAEKMIAAIRRPTGRFMEFAQDLALDLDALTARLATITEQSTLDDFFPAAMKPHYTLSEQCVLIAKLLVDAGYAPGSATLMKGDLSVDERKVVDGDLVVEGSLRVGAQLVVMGNLVADTYEDEYSATSVAGNLEVTRGIYSQSFLSVAGQVKTPFLCLDFNQGFAKILGGCDTTILIEFDHGGSHVFGPIRTKFIRSDELRADHALTDSSDDTLARLLHDDLKTEAVKPNYNLGSMLWNHIKAGKRLLA